MIRHEGIKTSRLPVISVTAIILIILSWNGAIAGEFQRLNLNSTANLQLWSGIAKVNTNSSSTVAKTSSIQSDTGSAQNRSPQINWGGYALFRYAYEGSSDNRFWIETVRIKATGKFDEHLTFFIMVDVPNQANLKDAYLTYTFNKFVQLKGGQYKYRFGIFETPWDLATIKKPMVISNYFADARDIGLEILGEAPSLKYNFGIVNGVARGVPEDDKRKTFVGSINYEPLAGLQVGFSGYNGTRDFPKTISGEKVIFHEARRDRWGGHLWYNANKALFQAEFIRGYDYKVSSQGYYIVAGYQLSKALQPVTRFEYFDPDTILRKNGSYIYAIGLNFFRGKSMIIRGIYEIQDFESGIKLIHSITFQAGCKF
jgi:hypothetical protein